MLKFSCWASANRTLIVSITAALLAVHSATAAKGQDVTISKYPDANRSDLSDDYFGTTVADPYRWLEDSDSPQTASWVKSQVAVTSELLGKFKQRSIIRDRLETLWNYERFSIPVRRKGYQLFTHNDGLKNQSVLMIQPEGQSPEVLLDPNTWSKKGTTDLAQTSVSWDGSLLAYAVGMDGSDWREVKVLDVQSRKTLSDVVKWMKFSSISWTTDNKGFFYSRYDTPGKGEIFTAKNEFHKVYYHRMGTDQADDELIYQRPDQAEWGFNATATEDGKFVVIDVWKGTLVQNQVFIKRLDDPTAEVIPFQSGFGAQFDYLGNDGDCFYFLTDQDASLRRIVSIDLNKPSKEDWVPLIAESTQVIQGANLVGNSFLVSYLKDASSNVKHFDIQGNFVRDIPLAGIGSAGGFGGKRSDADTFYSYSSYTTPGEIYQYDLESGVSKRIRQAKVEFESNRFQTSQVFFTSKDGTKVPMFLVRRKDVQGPAPTILYGYGGFDISLTPGFSVADLAWVEAGGVYAVASLRGGGEYGQAWHEAGMLGKKQNVFDDFIAAGEYLVDQKITGEKQLAIYGGSNGGLLVGAVMIQRPELYAAAVPAVGVLDMLRFHKFTIGHAWTPEYGCSEKESDFNYLLRYSPLQNLKKGVAYPPTMVMTADHDDRVVPAHSFKFAAQLQHCQKTGAAPTVIRIETSGGHGAGKPVTMAIDSAADRLAFIAFFTGLQFELESK